MKPTSPFSPFSPFLTLLTLLTLSLLFTSCKSPSKPQSTLVTIDILTALKTEKEFRLSEMVDSIEYVKLETRPECLVSSAWRVIGEKYILLLNGTPPQVLLFDRTGKFLRPIGKIGKGPGEYTYPDNIDLSPDEERIIVKDGRQRLLMEYSVNGTFIAAYQTQWSISKGPYYIDEHQIVFMQTPLTDSAHYPRVVVRNLETDKHTSLCFTDYKTNPQKDVGYCLGNDFFSINGNIVFKDALSDTVYQILPDISIKPVYCLNSFTPKAIYYCMTEPEMESLSRISLAGFMSQFVFFIGTDTDRFHLVYNSATKQAFRLPELKGCRTENNYAFGIINDLDGTGPYWFWREANIRNNVISNLLQIVDLKETIKTDCFLKADLKTSQYRDQLKKLVEESSDNDNPIIRILRTK